MKRLVLIPTDFERQLIVAALSEADEPPNDEMHVCGFGPIAAASRTAFLISQHRPDQVLLVGIAGALSERVAIGKAYEFAAVLCDGIGVGAGDQFQSAAAIGWPQLEDATGDSPRIDDRIEGLLGSGALELLTVCSGSATEIEADQRRRRNLHADAEDMEGFGVALSCRLAGVPLRIVRGISNLAGDRNQANWEVKRALASAAKRMLET